MFKKVKEPEAVRRQVVSVHRRLPFGQLTELGFVLSRYAQSPVSAAHGTPASLLVNLPHVFRNDDELPRAKGVYPVQSQQGSPDTHLDPGWHFGIRRLGINVHDMRDLGNSTLTGGDPNPSLGEQGPYGIIKHVGASATALRRHSRPKLQLSRILGLMLDSVVVNQVTLASTTPCFATDAATARVADVMDSGRPGWIGTYHVHRVPGGSERGGLNPEPSCFVLRLGWKFRSDYLDFHGGVR